MNVMLLPKTDPIYSLTYSITLFDCRTLSATPPSLMSPSSKEVAFGENFEVKVTWGDFAYVGHEDYCVP